MGNPQAQAAIQAARDQDRKMLEYLTKMADALRLGCDPLEVASLLDGTCDAIRDSLARTGELTDG